MTVAFDPDAYEPFKYWDDNREVHQRINAVHRHNQMTGKSNQPLVVDFVEQDEYAEAATACMVGRISDLDDNPDAKGLAYNTVKAHLDSPDKMIGEHGGPQYDPTDPRTMNRSMALLAFDPRIAFPLSKQYTWKDLADKYLRRYTTCDVGVSYGCRTSDATIVFAVPCGEFVCVYKSCLRCREWFDMPVAHREDLCSLPVYLDEWDRR